MAEQILIAFGGVSPEHEVSVITAIQAASVLMEEGNYSLQALYIAKDGRWYMGEPLLNLETYEQKISEQIKGVESCSFQHDSYGRVKLCQIRKSGLFEKPISFTPDIVFIAFHGSEGENGSFQGLCEQYNLPYTGSGVFASALGMHKAKAKQAVSEEEVPVVEAFTLQEAEWVENKGSILQKAENIGYPLIIKPVHLGSSIGVHQVKDKTTFDEKVEDAFNYDPLLLVEKMVRPLVEINCSVWVDKGKLRLSPCEQPKGKDEVLSFVDKYLAEDATKGMVAADRIIPAPISEGLKKTIHSYCERIVKAIPVSGVARIDFLVNAETNEVFFNEINTIPGSFSYYLWKEEGIRFLTLLKALFDDALYRHQQKNGRMRQYETNLLSKRAAGGLKGLKGKQAK